MAGGAPLSVVRELAVCPACRGGLGWSDAEARCTACGEAYPVVEGIPVFAAASGEQKAGQARYFDDEADPEFEITRPHGTPPFHEWLLREKFRRAVASLEGLRGGTALTVCGGSGMDAEFLARAGARVVHSDLSLGAVKRARERAARYGVELELVVADAERLPFGDRSIDLTYVHDGLHHLERPLFGLREMARVARRAVSVTEPARAAATAVAVRLGVAQEVEEAGNRVERLEPAEVERELLAAGLEIVRSERYAMFYRHEPGRPSRLLSAPALLPAAKAALSLANIVVGRVGNKLAVQAVRRDAGAPSVASPA